MLVTRERQKMLHALIYFSKNVLYPGKTKLFKLLNFLDFAHFKKTGRSVTGLEYSAWDRGPVPEALYREWKTPSREFISHYTKKSESAGSYSREVLVPRVGFDPKLFSKFELGIMESLAKAHFRDGADQMSELSHFETGYWQEVWSDGAGSGQHIPYELVLLRKNDSDDQSVMESRVEDLELRKNYG